MLKDREAADANRLAALRRTRVNQSSDCFREVKSCTGFWIGGFKRWKMRAVGELGREEAGVRKKQTIVSSRQQSSSSPEISSQ